MKLLLNRQNMPVKLGQTPIDCGILNNTNALYGGRKESR